jgi:putative surface cell wall-binding protein
MPCADNLGMRNIRNTSASARRFRIGLAAAASTLAVCVLPATALGATSNDTTQFSVTAGTLAFSTAPDVPDLNSVPLNGQSQTTNSQMTSYSLQDATGSGSGWNLTVAGNAPAGSAVFKEYCTSGTCGSVGYVTSGITLPANSLTLNSTSAGITAQNGSTGSGPTHQCNAGCFVDAGSASKVLSAASGNGMGTWQANSYSASSLQLATPSTLKVLPNAEVYRVNLAWTLSSGP